MARAVWVVAVEGLVWVAERRLRLVGDRLVRLHAERPRYELNGAL